MQPSYFTFREFLTQLVADMASAVSVRDGEPIAHRQVRTQLAARMIMDFLPRDAIEAMLAGRCVMFHDLTVDGVRRTLIGEADAQRRATRANIVALDRCFMNNLKLLENYRTRPSNAVLDDAGANHGTAGAEESGAPTQAAQTQEPSHAAASGSSDQTSPATAAPEADSVPFQDDGVPSSEMMEAILSNRAAMAALMSGDAEGCVRALGFDYPGEEFLAAAAQSGSPFDVTAWAGSPTARDADADQASGAPANTDRIMATAAD